MSVNEKMTTLANDVRGLSGAVSSLGLDAMHTQLNLSQVEVDTQADIIEQIKVALQGKVAAAPALQEKSVIPSEEQQIVLPDDGFDGLSRVIVEAMENNASSIYTTTATLSSRNRTISFTGLTEEPKMFAIIPTAQVTLSTSYRYVVNVIYDGSATHGIYAYGSSSTYRAYYSNTYFTTTYSDGTLSVKTSSTSNGGYFMNGVAYKLVAITGAVSSGDSGSTIINLQAKTVTPTTSQQIVVPDSGYDGLSQVTVNAIPEEEEEVTQYYLIQNGTKKVTFDSTDYTTSTSSGALKITQNTGLYECYEVSSPINLTNYTTLYCSAKNSIQSERPARLVVKNANDDYVVSKDITTNQSTVSVSVRSLGADMYPGIYTERTSDGDHYYGPELYVYNMWLE